MTGTLTHDAGSGEIAPSQPETTRERQTALAALALGGFFLLVLVRAPILTGPFDYEGEAREAECVADVVRHGHWIAPYPNGDRVPTKGPFLYWWAGLAASLFGLKEGVLRASIAVLAAGTVLCTAAVGGMLGGRRAGWLSAGMLGTAFLFWSHSVYLRVDMPLTFLVSLTFAGFVRGLLRPERRLLAWTLAQIALAGACFDKGLVGLVPTLPPILALLGLRRDWAGFRLWLWPLALIPAFVLPPAFALAPAALALAPFALRPAAWRRHALDLVPGALVVCLLFGWLALADRRYPMPYLEYVIQQSASRVGETGEHAPAFLLPFWWYVPRFLADFLPWTLFLPAGVAIAVRRWRTDPRDAAILPILWFALTFLLFSAFAYKRKAYLLPLFPAAALLAAAPWASLGSGRAEGESLWVRIAWVVLSTAGVLLIVAGLTDLVLHLAGGPDLLAGRATEPRVAAFRDRRVPADLGLAAAGALWASLLAFRGADAGRRRAVSALAGQTVLLIVAGLLADAAERPAGESPDRFARDVERLVPASADLRFAPGVRDHALLYYLDRRIVATPAADLTRWEESPPSEPIYFVTAGSGGVRGFAGAESAVLVEGAGCTGALQLRRVDFRRSDAPR